MSTSKQQNIMNYLTPIVKFFISFHSPKWEETDFIISNNRLKYTLVIKNQ